MSELIYKDESYQIVGVCMEVHRQLGKGFLEIVYKDAIEYEFQKRNIPFEREKEFLIHYKEITLPHKFFADFVAFDKIILEVKCGSGIAEEHISQTLNYLAVSKLKLGLIVNFGKESLETKRIVL
ncbi:MAG: GxxExxY protein [Ignavibacteria bacterium]|nr:GxxExxY protein [Ignavibacteria bacterium]